MSAKIETLKESVNYDLDNFNISIGPLMKDLEELRIVSNAESVRIREINKRKDDLDRMMKDLKKVKAQLDSIYKNVTLMNEFIIEEMEK